MLKTFWFQNSFVLHIIYLNCYLAALKIEGWIFITRVETSSESNQDWEHFLILNKQSWQPDKKKLSSTCNLIPAEWNEEL